MDIWNEQTMMVLHGPNPCEINMIRKRVLQYHWNHDQLMFKTLVVPKQKKQK
jgi:hypothetical protein